MASRVQKEAMVAQLRGKIDQAKSVVFVDYCGLNVAKITELRKKLRDAGVEMKVFKNTLAKRAIDELAIDELGQYLEGPTAGIFSTADPVAGPQVLKEFARRNKQLVIKGGSLEKKALDAGEVRALADLPSREVLLAQVVGAMQSPLVGLLNVLQGPLRKFGYAVEALRKEKEGA